MGLISNDTAYYKEFFAEIKAKVRNAQLSALRTVNKELINLYWEIGQSIIVKQEEQGWGKAVVEMLASELQLEFEGVQGFSSSNLWRMKNFYLSYKDNEKLAQLVREISWSHNIVIMERCKDDFEREYLMRMSIKFGWTRNILSHNIDVKSYENFLINQTSFDKTLPEKYKYQAKLAVKDDYNFAFLELGEEHSEKELEKALIENVRRFLLEMGGHFAFIGSQYRVEVDEREFFIDLLLYHRGLRCLTAIELKRGDFQPEYAGKMQFYLSALDAKVKLEDENPSIGIIICKSKSRTLVEYTLRDVNKPLGITTYTTGDILPKNFKDLLPSPEKITALLKILQE